MIFEVAPFGTYCAPYGTGGRELVRSLSEHLRVPHLALEDVRVGGRTLRGLDTVGSWPLVHGAHLTLLSERPHDPVIALSEHVLRTNTCELMSLAGIPGVRVVAAPGGMMRVRGNAGVPYLVARAVRSRRRVRSDVQQAHAAKSGLSPVGSVWGYPLLGVARAVQAVVLTVRFYMCGVKFHDGLLLYGVGSLKHRVEDAGDRAGDDWRVKRTVERYELRAPIDPAAVDQMLTEIAKPVSEESSSSKMGLLLSALIPFTMSVILAVVMRQPYFLLFALTGPILALVQLFSRRQPLPGLAEVVALPAWVHDGLAGRSLEALTTVLQLTVSGQLAVTGWPLLDACRETSRLGSTRHLTPHDVALAVSAQVLSALPHSQGGPDSAHTTPTIRALAAPPVLHVVTARPHIIHESWLRWFTPLLRIHESHGTVPDTPHRVLLDLDGAPMRAGITGADAHGVLEHWARALAAYLTTGSASIQLPDVAPFTHVWDPQAGAPAWRMEVENSLVIPLGIGSAGPFVIDLVADGPHMLVAGTTGSGKSEFLQSLITATAATYSAHDVNFMLIDYKGGAGLGRCNRLPHSCGMVTDLDPGETSRALTGLRTELKRREQKFHDAGVSNIAGYNRCVSRVERMARIVVVVDEFRALSDEHPEFLTELIRLAAQGRSLGIHLILATQRPAGAIGPELRANINLRVSLRVADEQDSLDVLGVTDGAHLPVDVPGRLLARTDGSPPEQAQAFYLDAAPLLPQQLVTLPGTRGVTIPVADVPDIIPALAAAHEAQFGIQAARFWSPGLPAVFTGQQETDIHVDTQVVALGAPDTSTTHQALTWDHKFGHLAVIGPALRGRTSALLTLAQCAPADTNVHWVGATSDHPNVRRALTETPARLVNLLDVSEPYLLHSLLRALIAPPASAHDERATTLLIIDDLEALRATLETYDRGSGMGLVENLLKTGPAHGISCAVSTARPITGGLQSLFGQRLILSSGNVDTDAMNSVPRDLLPLPAHRGRAVWSTPNSTIVCQIRTPHLEPPSAAQRSETGTEQRVWSLADVPTPAHPGILTGPQPCTFDPAAVNVMIVAGRRRSGRTTALTVLAAGLGTSPAHTRIIAGKSRTAGDELQATITLLESGAANLKLLQIDDLDAADTGYGHLVEQLLDLALDAGITVHGSCTTSALTHSYRGALAILRDHENVLLLDPDPAKDRELLGTPITLALDPRPYTGRAVLMLAGQATTARVDIATNQT